MDPVNMAGATDRQTDRQILYFLKNEITAFTE